MKTLNNSIDAVRRHLLKPKDNCPNVDTILGAIVDEFQQIYNELGNSSVAWTTKTFTLNLTGSGTVKVAAENVGKILFVTNTTYATDAPVAVEFTDLQDASTDWWFYQPIASDRPEDYGYWGAYPTKIAFYRKDGDLYAKIPPRYVTGTLSVTAATGLFDPELATSPVLPEYHSLAEIRAALNVLPGAEWTDNIERDDRKMQNLMKTLPAQESRIYEQFRIAKRSLTADEMSFAGTNDAYFD